MGGNPNARRRRTVALVLPLLALAVLSMAAEKEAGKGERPTSFLGNPARGKTLFLRHCAPCHGDQGKGNGPNAKNLDPPPRNLTDEAYMGKKSDEDLFDAVNEGGYTVNRSVLMPPWGKTFGGQGVRDVVAYLRTLHRPKPTAGQPAGKMTPAR
jgi:mono/diheme cytochrome c family protein